MGALIKICGIRRSEDADHINEAKPDYAGFIFWDKSFRYVDLETALRLRAKIDPCIRTVAVFVDESRERIIETVKSGAVSVVQLHGSEDETYIRKLREELPDNTKIWKAYKIRSAEDIAAAEASAADEILLDNGYGTGECFDHKLLGDGSSLSRRFILAGGMRPDNIADAIKKFSPYMIDISSGVETDKYKDKDKMIRAVWACRSCR